MINKIYCRVFQYIMKIVMYIIPWTSPEILKDEDALANKIKENSHKCILLVTGPNIYRRGLINRYINKLEENNIAYVLFNDIKSNPSDIEVKNGLKVYEDNDCDGILCIGGGSPMDTAKAIGAMHVTKKSIDKLHGLLKVRHKLPKMYMVPTTAGTGSETTIAAVINDSKTQRKAAITDINLMPQYCVLDPLLMEGLSPYLTAITAMDALTHAIEAYTNHLYNSKLEDKLALDAIKLIYDNLYPCFEDGKDLGLRYHLSLGAFYAGRAFTRASVGYVHALGHAISSLYDTSHGEMMAIILPKVLRQYGHKIDKSLDIIASQCGLKSGEDFIIWIEDMNTKMGIKGKIKELKREDFEHIIDLAIKEAHPLYPTPSIWNKSDFKTVLNKLV